MPDYGHRYADKKLSEVDRKLKQTYRQAQREMKEKLKDFDRKFESKSKEMRQAVASGEISKSEYQNWLQGKVFVRSLWQEKIKQVNNVLYDHNQQSLNLINNSRLDVFAENYNYSAYIAEKKLIGSFTLYNAEAVARLLLDEPDLLPKWKIDKAKDYAWSTKKINNVITQGIIQGESVPQITKRMCEALGSQDEDRMRTFARTAITGAENAGRQEQMKNAAEMGIKVNKRWEATHDSRTRDSHRAVDGEEVPYDDVFSNGLEYPGDPSGAPSEVYNCRCTMMPIYPDYEDYEASAKRYEDLEIEGQSYSEWKQGKILEMGGKNDTIGMGRMERKAQNQGIYASLSEPMTKKHIRRIAREYDISLKGITLFIEKGEEFMKESCKLTGRADHETVGRVDFYPKAFTTKEDLLRTIYHELIHVKQFKEYGSSFVMNNRPQFEKVAYDAEDEFIEKLKEEGRI